EVPPLPQASGTSTIVAPITVAIPVIRDLMESEAPRTFVGQRDMNVAQVVSNGQVAWNVARGPLAASGHANGLTVTTALNGTVHATGKLSPEASNLGSAIGGLLGGDLGRSVEKMAARPIDQRAPVRGNVTVTARPELAANWRIDPNLTANVA